MRRSRACSELEITLRAPFDKVVVRPPVDVLADLHELTRDGEPPGLTRLLRAQ